MENDITLKVIPGKHLETQSDSSFIKSLFTLFQEATLESDYMIMGEIASEGDVVKIFNNENLTHIILFIENLPVGYAQITHRATSYAFSSNAKINALSIIPQHRNHGLGKKLVQACLDWCLDNKIQLVYLDVVHKNTPAKHLYESFGFNKTGELAGAFKKDEEYLNIETYSKNL
jgi:ribosomal protein S18 acetylase RimI-like enzyme